MGIKMMAVCAAMTFAFLLGGCVVQTRSAFSMDENAQNKKREAVKFFQYEKDNFAQKGYVEITKKGTTAGHARYYKHFLVRFSRPDEKKKVVFHYFRQNGSGKKKKKPLVIILPITGGNYFFTEHFAKNLAVAGFHTIWVERKQKFVQQKEGRFEKIFPPILQNYRQMVVNTRRIIDWAERQEEIDEEKIGIMGISLGGIMSATLLGIEPRLKAGAPLLSGGDLAYIFTESTEEKEIAPIRKNLYKKEGWSKERMYQQFQNATKDIEPLRYARFIDPKTILLINGEQDTIVPKHSSDLLWEKMGKPCQVIINTGHYGAMGSLKLFVTPRVIQHFKKMFVDKKILSVCKK